MEREHMDWAHIECDTERMQELVGGPEVEWVTFHEDSDDTPIMTIVFSGVYREPCAPWERWNDCLVDCFDATGLLAEGALGIGRSVRSRRAALGEVALEIPRSTITLALHPHTTHLHIFSPIGSGTQRRAVRVLAATAPGTRLPPGCTCIKEHAH